jgi:hypothetical protein
LTIQQAYANIEIMETLKQKPETKSSLAIRSLGMLVLGGRKVKSLDRRAVSRLEGAQTRFETTSSRVDSRLKSAHERVTQKLLAREYQEVLDIAYNGKREPGQSWVNVNRLRKQDPGAFAQQAEVFDAYKQHLSSGLVESGTGEREASNQVQAMINEDPLRIVSEAKQWNVAQQAERQQLVGQ